MSTAGDPPGAVRDAFDELVGDLDYSMLIVTAAAGGEADGCLVGFATQASISPPLFAVCLSERNRTTRIAARTGHLGVHVVPSDASEQAELFGGETGDEVDKLSQVHWSAAADGTPILDGAPNRFVGRILERRQWGDHVTVLLEPVFVEHPRPVRPLTIRRAVQIDSGHGA